MKTNLKTNQRAFTLIELLIVVLIIAILAAIAVPNFLEFQTRAKVSRAKSDLRTVAIALEAYLVDNDTYPIDNTFAQYLPFLISLTSPIAYLTTANYEDPFFPEDTYNDPNYSKSYRYVSYEGIWGEQVAEPRYGVPPKRGAVIYSLAPDRIQSFMEHYPFYAADPSITTPLSAPTFQGQFPGYHTHMLYDPTNGTISQGDIGYFVGELPVSGFPNE